MEVLRADAHFAKVLLQFGRNAIALHGLLNGLVVRPDVEPPLGEIRQRVVRLLGERRGEVPRTHHVQVILRSAHPPPTRGIPAGNPHRDNAASACRLRSARCRVFPIRATGGRASAARPYASRKPWAKSSRRSPSCRCTAGTVRFPRALRRSRGFSPRGTHGGCSPRSMRAAERAGSPPPRRCPQAPLRGSCKAKSRSKTALCALFSLIPIKECPPFP